MLYNPPSGSLDPNASYVGKNVAAGIQGSKVPRLAIEATQREIVEAIKQSGQTPTNDDLGQLWKAIKIGSESKASDVVSNYVTNNYAKGSFIARRVFSTVGTTTYVPSAGTTKVRVIVQGGGGGGGGTRPTGSGEFACAGGGGSGGCAVSDLTNGFANVPITVGAGGAGGVYDGGSTLANGNPGGASSFGTALSATGGSGGATGSSGTSANVQAGGNKGVGVGGNVSNEDGVPGLYAASFSNVNFATGGGAASAFGGGAVPIYSRTSPGIAGTSYGSGGSGGGAQSGVVPQAGGAGQSGCVIVEEYA